MMSERPDNWALQCLLDVLPVAAHTCDSEGIITGYNQRAVELWGRQPRVGDRTERFCGSHKLYRLDSTFIAPGDTPVAAALRTGQAQRNVEAILERPDGSRHFIEVNCHAIRDEAAAVIGAIAIVQDITDRKRAEEERRRLQDQHRLLLQSVEDYAILMLDPNGIITTWNVGAERMTGFKAEEAIGRSIASFHPPDDVDQNRPLMELREAAATGRVQHDGWRLRKDGSRFLAECITVALKNEWGNVLGFCRVARDITSVRREEESLRSIVDHSVDAIFTINQQGIIQSCGGAVRKIFGYLPSELVGQPVGMLLPEPWRGEHGGYISSYLRTGVAKIIGKVREVTGLRKDGSTVPLEITITEFSRVRSAQSRERAGKAAPDRTKSTGSSRLLLVKTAILRETVV